MIHAEISLYPMGTGSASASFYIARALESIQGIDGIKSELTPMGTIFESPDIEGINRATQAMLEAVHSLGVSRVEVVIKIDSRRDRQTTLQHKVDSVRRQLEPS